MLSRNENRRQGHMGVSKASFLGRVGVLIREVDSGIGLEFGEFGHGYGAFEVFFRGGVMQGSFVLFYAISRGKLH